MAILEISNVVEGHGNRYIVECPGCKMEHVIATGEGPGPRWTFNGNMEKPTFSPSLLVTYTWGPEHKSIVCHSFIVDGVWQFLTDCTHELAGQHVPMIDVEW